MQAQTFCGLLHPLQHHGSDVFSREVGHLALELHLKVWLALLVNDLVGPVLGLLPNLGKPGTRQASQWCERMVDHTLTDSEGRRRERKRKKERS